MKDQEKKIVLESMMNALKELDSVITGKLNVGHDAVKLLQERNKLYSLLVQDDEKFCDEQYLRILSEEEKPDIVITCPNSKNQINLTKLVNHIKELSFMYADGNNAGQNNLSKEFCLKRDFRFLHLLQDVLLTDYNFYLEKERKVL